MTSPRMYQGRALSGPVGLSLFAWCALALLAGACMPIVLNYLEGFAR